MIILKEIKLSIDSKEYPNSLRNGINPPKILYCLGNIDLLYSNCIAIVGPRHLEQKQLDSIRRLSSIVSNLGFTVVSGLAIGTDTYAHLGCLDTNGKTIAVLATGVGVVYPKSNTYLYNSILEKDGLIVSEHPFNTKLETYNLPRRNRIQVGLSLGTIVPFFDINGSKGGTKYSIELTNKSNKPLYTTMFHTNHYLVEHNKAMIITPKNIEDRLSKLKE